MANFQLKTQFNSKVSTYRQIGCDEYLFLAPPWLWRWSRWRYTVADLWELPSCGSMKPFKVFCCDSRPRRGTLLPFQRWRWKMSSFVNINRERNLMRFTNGVRLLVCLLICWLSFWLRSDASFSLRDSRCWMRLSPEGMSHLHLQNGQ